MYKQSLLSCYWIAFFSMWLVVISAYGCQSSEENHSDIQLDWAINPDPPTEGMATLHINLTDSSGHEITGAEIDLEGNMSHPGMQPVFTGAEEVEPGKYLAEIEFTMGGDWFILVESKLTDGRVVERQIDIAGVRSQ